MVIYSQWRFHADSCRSGAGDAASLIFFRPPAEAIVRRCARLVAARLVDCGSDSSDLRYALRLVSTEPPS
jgi:hypothetical protein